MMFLPAQLMKSIRGLDKHYSLYFNGDKKMTKIKDKALLELFKIVITKSSGI